MFGRAPLCTGRCPRFFRQVVRGYGRLFPFDRLHHLTDHAVKKHHDRHAVLVGKLKGLLHQVDDFLNIGGGEDDQPVVTVASAARRLEIVRLVQAGSFRDRDRRA